MNKEKIQRLQKYVNDIQTRLNDEVPAKHQGHPDTYKAFLRNEIRLSKLKIEQLSLEGK